MAEKNQISEENWKKIKNELEKLKKGPIDVLKLPEDSKKIGSIDNSPGIYKWWAKESAVETILEELDLEINFDKIRLYLEYDQKNDLYCIYVGQAGNASSNSLRSRLKKHMSPNLYNSTFRQTIGCLIKEVRKAEKCINKLIADYIKNFKITYYPINEEKLKVLKSLNENKDVSITDIEEKIINDSLHILNIQDNDYKKYNNSSKIKEKLKDLRKEKEKY